MQRGRICTGRDIAGRQRVHMDAHNYESDVGQQDSVYTGVV